MPRLLILSLVLAVLATGCRAPDHAIVDTPSRRRTTLAVQAAILADRDVVLLGEIHDSAVSHRLQTELTGLLMDRRNAVLSLEMFERDVQPVLDEYLDGAIDEETFLEGARPWKNYAESYREALELARALGRPVVAANLPRPVAQTIAQEGLAAVSAEPTMPTRVSLDTFEYRERFERAMGEHEGFEREVLDRWFAAQCAKDDAMAESILAALDAHAAEYPLVVHWCGRFHSDRGLGIGERLLARRPELRVAVVTTVPTDRVERPLARDEREAADWVWLVRD